jgi:hypothetical protein
LFIRNSGEILPPRHILYYNPPTSFIVTSAVEALVLVARIIHPTVLLTYKRVTD